MTSELEEEAGQVTLRKTQEAKWVTVDLDSVGYIKAGGMTEGVWGRGLRGSWHRNPGEVRRSSLWPVDLGSWEISRSLRASAEAFAKWMERNRSADGETEEAMRSNGVCEPGTSEEMVLLQTVGEIRISGSQAQEVELLDLMMPFGGHCGLNPLDCLPSYKPRFSTNHLSVT